VQIYPKIWNFNNFHHFKVRVFLLRVFSVIVIIWFHEMLQRPFDAQLLTCNLVKMFNNLQKSNNNNNIDDVMTSYIL